MVDTVPQTEAELAQPDAPEALARPSFLSTSAGKVVLAVVAVFVLVIVAGVALFLFFIRGVDVSVDGTVAAPPAATDSQQEQQAEPIAPTDDPLSSTFVFRNIFAPTVKAPAPPKEDSTTDGTSGTDGTDGTSGGTTAGTDELMLVGVQTVDGERTATMSWNGETYLLTEGEEIPGTPWKIVDIGSDYVSVIYGDSSPIELTVGSSVSK